MSSKLYLSGIEIGDRKEWRPLRLTSKLYLSGIEIKRLSKKKSPDVVLQIVP